MLLYPVLGLGVFVWFSAECYSRLIPEKARSVGGHVLFSMGLGPVLAFLVLFSLDTVLTAPITTLMIQGIVIIFLTLSIASFPLRQRRAPAPPLPTRIISEELSSLSVQWKIGILMIIGILAIVAYKALALPFVFFDELSYHGPNAAYIFNNGMFSVTGGTVSPEYTHAFPPLVEANAAFGYFVNGEIIDSYFRFVTLFTAIGLLAAVYLISRMLWKSRRAALFSVAVAISIAFVQFSMRAYVDVPFAFYSVLSVYFMLRYVKKSGNADMTLSGLFAGASALVKYSGVIFFIMILGILLFIILYNRYKYGIKITTPLKGFIAAVSIGALVALPWYLRNLYFFENPMYPFLYSTFGGKDLPWPIPGTADGYFFSGTEWISVLSGLAPLLGVLALSAPVVIFLLNRKSRIVLLLLLIFIFMMAASFYSTLQLVNSDEAFFAIESERFFIGASAIGAVMAGGFISLLAKVERKEEGLLRSSMLIAVFLLLLLAGSYALYSEYGKLLALISAGGVGAFVIALIIKSGIHSDKGFMRKIFRILPVIILMAILLAPVGKIAMSYKYNILDDSMPPFKAVPPTDEVLADSGFFEYFGVWSWANENLPEGSVVLSDTTAHYYLEYNTVFTHSYSFLGFNEVISADEKLEFMRNYGITHVIAKEDWMADNGFIVNNILDTELDNIFLENVFGVNIGVYRLA